MSKKNDSHKTFNVAVVGLSGSEKDRGCLGSGKSCLCNRFVRPFADDYYTDHISVLSQSDFSGRIVNNDHWLYWGEVSKITEEGIELHFSVIEQTEFVDDACFQPFRAGSEPYVKRCAATKLTSAEKLMYICKNQLGIEKEYEQKYLADGRFNVDGFICVFDVSEIQGRSLEKNLESTLMILNNLMKTKKPIVVATTKHDEASEMYVREVERLVNRKEFRGSIPLIETSSHENVNVDLAFVVCAQLHDRSKGRAKLIPFHESVRFRKEALDYASDAFHSLLTIHVTDYRTVWGTVCKTLSQTPEFLNFVDLFGQEAAQGSFKRHVKKLRDDYIGRKMQMYIRVLPEILHELLPDLESGESGDLDWESVKIKIRDHPDFDQYFVINLPHIAWHEIDVSSSNDSRIPWDLLDTDEAEECFYDLKRALEGEDRRRELRTEFRQLLQDTGYVTPGKLLNEVRVLFMGRECYESLHEQDVVEVYDDHQKEITDLARVQFQELLQEHSPLFYHFASLGPRSLITQEDILEITDALSDDTRFKNLDRLDQDRTLMILRHLGFVHGPVREHCPVYPACFDVLIEQILPMRARGSVLKKS